MTTPQDLEALALRVEALTKCDNAADVLVECAMFDPDGEYKACRPNFAGTKVIYTQHDGREYTFWASEWTATRIATAFALRERAQPHPEVTHAAE